MFPGITSYEIFSRHLGCQKFTSSTPGCCEEKGKPIIIRDADGARHPDRNPDHKRSGLKPRLSAGGAKPFISYFPERFTV